MSDSPSVSSKKSHISYSSSPYRDDSTSRGDCPERATYQPPEVAKQEEANILKAKILVALIIVLAACGVGSATYLLVKDQETTNFENQFTGYSSEIITVSRQKADQLFSALDAFSASVASQAAAENTLRNTTWPFYVIPDWSIKAQRLTKLTGVSNPEVTLVSIVQPDERVAFNEFAREAVPMWYRESVENEKSEMTAIEFWQRTIQFIHFYDNLQPTPVTDKNESQVHFQVYPLMLIRGVPLTPIMYDSAHSGGTREGVVDESSVVSYRVDGQNVEYLGDSDVHNPKYDAMEIGDVFVDLGIDESHLPGCTCIPTLTLHVYPSADLEHSFRTSNATLYTIVVVVIFIFTSLVFLLYDYFVRRRQTKVMERIVRQDKIVSNVFPTAIRDRLYRSQNSQKNFKFEKDFGHDVGESFQELDFERDSNISGSAPLADLFPSVTVVFADIAGFTAWSSAREPGQVFVLLETLYGAFDKIAYRHNVFKVETVGDCYVGAAGLPEPDDRHAVTACKFARDCLRKMAEATVKLEVMLGPDTADLDLRTGIHSGQVTAGVLRGERCRFQLFGETMNTAARMEQSGKRNRIQVSQVTADLLRAAALAQWIMPRGSKISVKGKGEMQTYWLRKSKTHKVSRSELESDMTTHAELLETEEESDSYEEPGPGIDSDQRMTKIERLVEWNVEVLASLLQQIIASRDGVVNDIASLSDAEKKIGSGAGTVLDEFTPTIPLKRFEAEDLRARRRPSSIEIGDEAKLQLRKYLSQIAALYRDNPFHNFEHASHVTASVKKLLTRIVKVGEGNGLAISSGKACVNDDDLVGHSYGITSDPLTQFAVVFSAIIHDVDHPGVPNSQLVKENTRIAEIYTKSIAEQNSVELAWDMLMGVEYSALRACIYQTESDLQRFRQLVVNTVMATDIVDKELQALRKNRWEAAFSDASTPSAEEHDDRKATIVIEHLIQASDVSHTMQHWHIYKDWNERFFMECYGAFKAGRSDSDPSVNWYKGEIGFFDFYVIPLAKKLESCGVFGVSSDEYLNYANANREEWVREGKALVQQYVAKYNSEH
eukprot:scaffold14714_cov108-Cylindrotheca_fusiformis.AAC.2